MTLTITIEMDNAAFDGRDSGREASRILKRLADKMYPHTIHAGDGGKIMDVNGNSVGEWRVTSN